MLVSQLHRNYSENRKHFGVISKYNLIFFQQEKPCMKDTIINQVCPKIDLHSNCNFATCGASELTLYAHKVLGLFSPDYGCCRNPTTVEKKQTTEGS